VHSYAKDRLLRVQLYSLLIVTDMLGEQPLKSRKGSCQSVPQAHMFWRWNFHVILVVISDILDPILGEVAHFELAVACAA